MVVKKNITLIYQYNENWIGGTYYIQNIIKALNFLKDADKPELTIISKQGTSFPQDDGEAEVILLRDGLAGELPARRARRGARSSRRRSGILACPDT